MTPARNKADEYPTLPFERREDWAAWLEANHAAVPGVWLRMAKKGAGIPSVTYAEAVEEALRYGWIDGQAKSEGPEWYVQKFTPRGPRSIWSKVNRQKVEALVAAGRMQPAGLAAVEAARRDGRWDAAYDPPSAATVSEDLQAALDANPRAKEFFATLDGRNRYAVLHRIQTAKKPETRASRIHKFVAMLENGEKLYP